MTGALETREIDTDVLVVGGGAAGVMAAIKAKIEGAKVLVVNKGPFPSGNSSIALGGYSVALGDADPRDNPDVHFEDVIRAGNGLNNRRVVRAWVKEIVGLTREMDAWGIDLIKENNTFAQRAWNGNTYPRMVHHNMTTGQAVMRCLRNRAKKDGLVSLDHTIIGGLLTGEEGIVGGWGIQYQNGQFLLISAKAVVLATGGMGHLFPTTDNIRTITGEGYALAFRAGAELMDMEMIHFLTTLVSPVKLKPRHVIIRSLLDMINSGGRLYNGLGERFMKKHSETGEREKGDKQISQAIGLEICEGRTTAHGGVYLDVSDVPPELRKKIFSNIWSKLERAGVDLRYQPVGLAPNPHDIMGGVRIDETGQTSVRGLFAAGEAAGGSHGAARVGGSALSDALAFGAIAGRNAARFAQDVKAKGPFNPDFIAAPQREVEALLSRKGGIPPVELRRSVQAIAHRYLNTVRNEEGLNRALRELEGLESETLPRLSACETDPNLRLVLLRESIEVSGQLELAKLIATAARFRKESRGGPFGGHYRSDFPSQDDRNWLKNIVLKKENGTISCRTAPPVMEE